MGEKTIGEAIIYQPFSYNGTEIQIGSIRKVKIKPPKKKNYIEYDKDKLLEKVIKMRDNKNIHGVPKNVMLKYLNFDFKKNLW